MCQDGTGGNKIGFSPELARLCMAPGKNFENRCKVLRRAAATVTSSQGND
jgi:hypothetical protein